MRYFYTTIFAIFTLICHENIVLAIEQEKQSIIIEVEGDPAEHQIYIEQHYPSIDVVATYETLLNGLALQAPPKKLAQISPLPFVKATHPVKMYEQHVSTTQTNISKGAMLPVDLHTTNFTGKGIKVGVIDTGIDYMHPDLAGNYAGGYDVVDFDDDPMETTAEQGMPTLHGTHVAGIIGANGQMKGVAPEADLYAYRALGPGGSGSSIQVIAAMEQALKDGVDIMNLSLGNIVNGPDYPTSIAVNRATDLGVAVVIANGNNGPNHWTVGAPATATKSIAVGALAAAQKVPYLYERQANQSIPIMIMQGSLPWEFTKDYQILSFNQQQNGFQGKIALIKRGDTSFYEKAKKAEHAGAIAAIIYNNEAGDFQGSVENEEDPLQIPVASITKKDGDWLLSQLQMGNLYIDTTYKETDKTVAPFSSRGPVTMNWRLKPDILAPGTNVLSTVPGGYQSLQGTSMAAPYVAGAIAIMKEAHPTWNNRQIIGALKTTATRIKDEDDQPVDPSSQGMGEMQLQKAIKTGTIIDNTLLSFGKIDTYRETHTIQLTIENMTNEDKAYRFDMPKQREGLQWKLPQSFTLIGKEKKTIPIELSVTTQQLNHELHQGWLALHQADETFHLPYLFINQTADYPKVMGFDFSLKPFSEDMYTYHLYITEEAERVEVNLYDPDTLVYNRRLLQLTDLETGMNEGEIKRSTLGESGHFKAIVTIQMTDGTYESHETELWIE